jgi:hypothetical protein
MVLTPSQSCSCHQLSPRDTGFDTQSDLQLSPTTTERLISSAARSNLEYTRYSIPIKFKNSFFKFLHITCAFKTVVPRLTVQDISFSDDADCHTWQQTSLLTTLSIFSLPLFEVHILPCPSLSPSRSPQCMLL